MALFGNDFVGLLALIFIVALVLVKVIDVVFAYFAHRRHHRLLQEELDRPAADHQGLLHLRPGTHLTAEVSRPDRELLLDILALLEKEVHGSAREEMEIYIGHLTKDQRRTLLAWLHDLKGIVRRVAENRGDLQRTK